MPITTDQQANMVKTVIGLFNASPDENLMSQISTPGDAVSDGNNQTVGTTHYVYDSAGKMVQGAGTANTGVIAADTSEEPLGFLAIEDNPPDAGIFEMDVIRQYTGGPADRRGAEIETPEPAAMPSDGFPNGRRPSDDTREPASDTFVFKTGTLLDQQQVVPDLGSSGTTAVILSGGPGRASLGDTSNAVQDGIPEADASARWIDLLDL